MCIPLGEPTWGVGEGSPRTPVGLSLDGWMSSARCYDWNKQTQTVHEGTTHFLHPSFSLFFFHFFSFFFFWKRRSELVSQWTSVSKTLRNLPHDRILLSISTLETWEKKKWSLNFKDKSTLLTEIDDCKRKKNNIPVSQHLDRKDLTVWQFS